MKNNNTNMFNQANITSTNGFTWTNSTSTDGFTQTDISITNGFTYTNKTSPNGFTWRNITITNKFAWKNELLLTTLIMDLLKETELGTDKIRGNIWTFSKFKMKSLEHNAFL